MRVGTAVMTQPPGEEARQAGGRASAGCSAKRYQQGLRRWCRTHCHRPLSTELKCQSCARAVPVVMGVAAFAVLCAAGVWVCVCDAHCHWVVAAIPR